MQNVLRSFCARSGLAMAGVAGLFGVAGVAGANTIDLSTPVGSLDAAGEPVLASAEVVTGADSVIVRLQNWTANPKSVGQNISDFGFQLSDGTTATLTGSAGTERTVIDDGTFTDGSTVSTGWQLDPTTTGLIHLNVLGTPEAPQHTIIGQPDAGGVYSNANSSIAKTGGPHNPFLTGLVTFELTVPGVSKDTTLSHPFFSFGTTPGDNVAAVPLPSSALGGAAVLGLAALGAARGRRTAC